MISRCLLIAAVLTGFCGSLSAAPQSESSSTPAPNEASAPVNPAQMEWFNEQWPAGSVARSELPSGSLIDYSFNDAPVADLVGWLEWAGVELPVELDGSLTGWLWARRANSNWLALNGYRIEGEIQSPNLQVNEWTIESATLRFGYLEGTWYVGRIAGRARVAVAAAAADNENKSRQASEIRQASKGALDDGPNDGLVGELDARAQIPTAGEGKVQIAGQLQRLFVRPLLLSLGVPIEVDNESGEIHFQVAGPLSDATDISLWTASAQGRMAKIRLPLIESASGWVQVLAVDLRIDAELDSANWLFADSAVVWNDREFPISAAGKLSGQIPFSANIASDGVAIEQLVSELLTPQSDNALPWLSRLGGTGKLRGGLTGSAESGVETAEVVVELPRLAFGQLNLTSARVQADYDGQSLVTSVSVEQFAEGSLQATATWAQVQQVVDQLPQQLDLQVDDVRLAELRRSLEGIAELASILQPLPAIASGMSGNLEFRTDFNDQPYAWAAQANLTLEDLVVANSSIGQTHLTLSKVERDSAASTKLVASDGSIKAEATLQFLDEATAAPKGWVDAFVPQRFTLNSNVSNFETQVDLAQFDLPPAPLTIQGEVAVSGDRENWFRRGQADLSRLQTAISDQALALHDVKLSFSSEEIRLQQFRLYDNRGRVAGAAVLRRNAAGEHQLNLRVVDLQWKPYVNKLFPDVAPLPSGRFDLELRLSKPADDGDLFTNWRGTIAAALRDLTLDGRELGQVTFRGQLQDDVLDGNLSGSVAGGQVSSDLRLPLHLFRAESLPDDESLAANTVAAAEPKPGDKSAIQVSGRIVEVDLEEALALVIGPREASRYAGRASVDFTATGETPMQLVVQSDWRLPTFARDRDQLLSNVRMQIGFGDGTLRLNTFAGEVAGGRVSARGPLFSISNPNAATTLQFEADRIDAGSLMLLVLPEYADDFTGRLSYRGRARVARVVELTGTAKASRAFVYGLPIQDLLGRMRIELSRSGEFRLAQSRDLHGTAIGGKMVGEFSLRGGSRYELNANASIGRGKMEQLSRGLGFDSVVGSGRFNGRVELRSNAATELAALNGRLQLDFEGGDVQTIPILSELGRYLPILQLASTDIQQGTMHATIGQGQLRIQDLLLSGDAFLLAAQGNASLSGGQLDVNALVQTGGDVTDQLAQEGAQRLALAIVPQAALLAELNDLLSNRSLYFHIVGTMNHPVIQPRAAQTIGKALLQTIQRELLLAPTAVSATD